MKRAIIIDDEASGIESLRIMLEKYAPEIKVVASSTDANEGCQLVNNYMPDILFLDISMPEMSGFDLLEKIVERPFKLVFTTAHPQYAIKAVRARASDYLLKPISADELMACVENLVGGNKSPHPNKNALIELPVRDGVIFVKPRNIIRLEAEGSYTTFHLDNGIRHVLAKNLKECSKLLDPYSFFRCHASHIVNLNKVTKMLSVDGLFALMSDGSKPEIARKNKELFLDKLKTL